MTQRLRGTAKVLYFSVWTTYNAGGGEWPTMGHCLIMWDTHASTHHVTCPIILPLPSTPYNFEGMGTALKLCLANFLYVNRKNSHFYRDVYHI